jgi:hypothetical protein
MLVGTLSCAGGISLSKSEGCERLVETLAALGERRPWKGIGPSLSSEKQSSTVGCISWELAMVAAAAVVCFCSGGE